MDDIPEDIEEIAGRIVLDFSFDAALLEGAICAALVKERERCAQIAEREADDYWDKATLVAAIRRGNQP